ncbi:unnamed protein product [Caretta caretta]
MIWRMAWIAPSKRSLLVRLAGKQLLLFDMDFDTMIYAFVPPRLNFWSGLYLDLPLTVLRENRMQWFNLREPQPSLTQLEGMATERSEGKSYSAQQVYLPSQSGNRVLKALLVAEIPLPAMAFQYYGCGVCIGKRRSCKAAVNGTEKKNTHYGKTSFWLVLDFGLGHYTISMDAATFITSPLSSLDEENEIGAGEFSEKIRMCSKAFECSVLHALDITGTFNYEGVDASRLAVNETASENSTVEETRAQICFMQEKHA